MIEEITYPTAVAAGLLSFFSPCVLPLVPSYFTFIAGVSLDDLIQTPSAALRRKIIIATSAFVLGFSLVFILMGASAAYLSGLLHSATPYLRIVGGIFIIILGLHLLGVIRIHALDMEKRFHLKQKPMHFLGTVVIGMAFGAGWSPCIGPLLGSILILAGSQDTVTQGIWLLSLYSAGLALPFVLLSLCINLLIGFVRRTSKALRYINIGAGILLVITGLLLITDKLRLLSSV